MWKSEAMTVKMPKPIAQSFVAANTDDADRIAACFAKDAVVCDEGRDMRGRGATRAGAAEVRL